MACEHENFVADVDVNRLTDNDGKLTGRFQADVRIKCHECGLPFRFIGLPAGVDLNGAAVSINGEEGRFSIAPKGEVRTPLEDVGCMGFTVRKSQ